MVTSDDDFSDVEDGDGTCLAYLLRHQSTMWKAQVSFLAGPTLRILK